MAFFESMNDVPGFLKRGIYMFLIVCLYWKVTDFVEIFSIPLDERTPLRGNLAHRFRSLVVTKISQTEILILDRT